MKKNKEQFNYFKIVFGLLLILFGVFAWLFWDLRVVDYTPVSVKLDGEICDLLAAMHISDADIVSQTREEKRETSASWIEYNKKIKVSDKFDKEIFSKKVAEISEKLSLTASNPGSEEKAWVISIGRPDKVFSRIVLIPGLSTSKVILKSKRLAIVIDDVGYKRDFAGFLELGIPITFAVLPKERNSAYISEQLVKKGIPFIMHLPLQPEGYPRVDPGKAALLLSMSENELGRMFDSNLKSLPGVTGVSNHMGSQFSADQAKMKYVLNLVKKNGLFYFDSYTTSKSKAAKAGRSIGMQVLENGIFLDTKEDEAYMKHQLDTLLNKFKKHNVAIAVGHIHKKYLVSAIKEYIPKFREAGVEFVYLHQLYDKD